MLSPWKGFAILIRNKYKIDIWSQDDNLSLKDSYPQSNLIAQFVQLLMKAPSPVLHLVYHCITAIIQGYSFEKVIIWQGSHIVPEGHRS